MHFPVNIKMCCSVVATMCSPVSVRSCVSCRDATNHLNVLGCALFRQDQNQLASALIAHACVRSGAGFHARPVSLVPAAPRSPRLGRKGAPRRALLAAVVAQAAAASVARRRRLLWRLAARWPSGGEQWRADDNDGSPTGTARQDTGHGGWW